MQDENPFDRLAPFIQDFIYRNRWTELHAVQVEACRVVFDSDDNLLLCSGTASGKTEAAFLPCLTLLSEHPAASVGILYVSPLKALINDQFERLDALLEEGGIPVCKWHGDVGRAAKERLLRRPQGVLQITPESLESLLMNKRTEVCRLFCDLRFVVIDEVHCFMSSDRGTQLLCQLERIQRLTGKVPRRIGLSATLGDSGEAERWLCSGTGRRCRTPAARGGGMTIRLMLEHFYVPSERGEKKRKPPAKSPSAAPEPAAEPAGQPPYAADAQRPGYRPAEPGLAAPGLVTPPELAAGENPAGAAPSEAGAYQNFLYESTLGRRCILYAGSRGEIEAEIAALKQTARRRGTDDVYLIHHGSLSAAIREHAERAMKTSDTPLVTGATVTLELGIDIGRLNRVVQLGSPHSVSSFLQRLGRTGRRGGPSEMWFACKEEPPVAGQGLVKSFGWDFLETVAVLQLYLEDRWVEPLSVPRCPYGLLYHQTMSVLYASGEMTPPELARAVLTLSPFRHVSQQDYRLLLRHLLSIDHLERTERGGLMPGLAGERVAGSFRFFAVFEAPEEFAVRHEGEEIGSLSYRLPVGERFALAGRTWEVTDVDSAGKVLYVKAASAKSHTEWSGPAGPVLPTRLLKKMRDVLRGDTVYRYLGPRARRRLGELRAQARRSRILERVAVPLGGDSWGLFPWVGTRALTTLSCLLGAAGFSVDAQQSREPYVLVVHTADPDALRAALRRIRDTRPDPSGLVPEKAAIPGKFNEFLPRELLRKQFVEDFLDVDDLCGHLELPPDEPRGAES